MIRRVVIVGATSGIGRALARRIAEAGAEAGFGLVLAGREAEPLVPLADDVAVRFGVDAAVECVDATAFATHADFFARCREHGQLAGIVLCQGEMPDPVAARSNFDLAERMIDVNYVACVSLLEQAASHLEERGEGFVCVIGSVAGDRGRPGNYLYGSSKAAVATFMQGLRARLSRSGVAAVTVKPGFVDTALTWGRPGMFLVASPEQVARDVWRGIEANRAVVYTPRFWALVMAVIRMIPTRLFDRLDL